MYNPSVWGILQYAKSISAFIFMDFKQQKKVILCKFISSNSYEKNHSVEQLDNTQM